MLKWSKLNDLGVTPHDLRTSISGVPLLAPVLVPFHPPRSPAKVSIPQRVTASLLGAGVGQKESSKNGNITNGLFQYTNRNITILVYNICYGTNRILLCWFVHSNTMAITITMPIVMEYYSYILILLIIIPTYCTNYY